MADKFCANCGARLVGTFDACPSCGVKIKKRFSIILLLAILVVGGSIGIFLLSCTAAILVPNFLKAKAMGQYKACEANLKNIGTALEMYATDNDRHYPPSLNALVSSGYMKTIPVCPGGREDSFEENYKGSYTYTFSNDPYNFTVYCKGAHHLKAHVPADYPMYTATNGLIEKPGN